MFSHQFSVTSVSLSLTLLCQQICCPSWARASLSQRSETASAADAAVSSDCLEAPCANDDDDDVSQFRITFHLRFSFVSVLSFFRYFSTPASVLLHVNAAPCAPLSSRPFSFASSFSHLKFNLIKSDVHFCHTHSQAGCSGSISSQGIKSKET